MDQKPKFLHQLIQMGIEPLNLLREAQAVLIQNVADYYLKGTEQEFWGREDFPNVAPPWPVAWFEYHLTDEIRASGRRVPMPQGQHLHTGVLIEAQDVENQNREKTSALFPRAEVRTYGKLQDRGIRWICRASIFFGKDHVPAERHPTSTIIFGVSPEGEIVDMHDNPRTLAKSPFLIAVYDGFYVEACQAADGPNWEDFAANRMTEAVFPVFLALSFMHCKNVVIEHVPGSGESSTPPGKKPTKKQRLPNVRSYVLEIEPMKKVLRPHQEHEGSLQKALHICRGHFKTFSEEAPLFGKHAGMWWWGMHVRGDSHDGAVQKDYSVNPPKPAL